MRTIKGPGLFLAQFISKTPPFDSLDGLASWASGLGFKALQIPCNHPHIFDLEKASVSKNYCDEIIGKLNDYGLTISELSTHLEGQLIAVHPAYRSCFSQFSPENTRHDIKSQQIWAKEQLIKAARASSNLKLKAHATFSGSFAWPFFYSWPPRPDSVIDEAFNELALRWSPILNAFDENDVDVCFELHPSEDLHDGITFERFLEKVNNHERCNILFDPSHMHIQNMDYLGFLDIYHSRIKSFHVKDAEFNKSSKSGVYGGYQNWIDRPGRFRSLGDGQIDFKSIFSKLSQYDFAGWAVLEWECCLKDSESGAREGAEFIKNHIINVTNQSFDDFAAYDNDTVEYRKLLGF